MVTLYIKPTSSGEMSFLRPMSDYIDTVVLAANTNYNYNLINAKTAGARSVVFWSDQNFYNRRGGVATVPSSSTTNGAQSAGCPVGYDITNETSIGFISPVACNITLEFYS